MDEQEQVQEQEIEIVKIDRTDDTVDNSVYILKEEYTVADDYGTEVVLYRKKEIDVETLTSRMVALQEEMDSITAILAKIETL